MGIPASLLIFVVECRLNLPFFYLSLHSPKKVNRTFMKKCGQC
ncbi:hypothetical protein CF65_00253 [Aggregatibacter actinomycetemcomitans HK1651]|nr:hypothetical protein CF65_00253 [Aggregatibacter actinomycetemcomitans HK1651]